MCSHIRLVKAKGLVLHYTGRRDYTQSESLVQPLYAAHLHFIAMKGDAMCYTNGTRPKSEIKHIISINQFFWCSPLRIQAAAAVCIGYRTMSMPYGFYAVPAQWAELLCMFITPPP